MDQTQNEHASPLMKTLETASRTWQEEYLAAADQSRPKRMKWFNDARFGMFIHWGLYSIMGRHEWAMNRERIPIAEYEKLASQWKPRKGAPREWAKLAKKAGMKYMVLTTKHHEGFSLWNSKTNPYNAVNYGPKRDLVREYVEAARAEGLKVGFYYSLMDWHHPDGHACANDDVARRRFLDYTQALVRELMTGYGKIDILWYDVSWPMNSPHLWDSYTMNKMVRELQPHIIINDRSQIPEDISTPEEHITPADEGRGWEACMTFNGAWGFVQTPPEDWHSARKVLELLRTCAAGGGNLLLNIGPKPDGSVPKEAVERLTKVGRWLKVYGEAVYGDMGRLATMEWLPMGNWTRRGKTLYFWCSRWPGKQMAIGGLSEKLKSARLLPHGKPLSFKQTEDRLVITGLPAKCPDKINEVAVVEMKFENVPSLILGAGCESCVKPHSLEPGWVSPHVMKWQLADLQEGLTLAKAGPLRLDDRKVNWTAQQAKPAGGGMPEGLLYTRGLVGEKVGVTYVGHRIRVTQAGPYALYLGHDSGLKLWVDGLEVFCDERFISPCAPARSMVEVTLEAGEHEIVAALDNQKAWGIFLCYGISPKHRRKGMTPVWPQVLG